MSSDMSTGTTTDEVPSRARLGRIALGGAAAMVVVAPILAGLVLAWQVHPLLVVPTYLVGIPAWLTLLSGAWSLVGRLRPTRDEPLGAAAPADRGPLDGADRGPHPRDGGGAAGAQDTHSLIWAIVPAGSSLAGVTDRFVTPDSLNAAMRSLT